MTPEEIEKVLRRAARSGKLVARGPLADGDFVALLHAIADRCIYPSLIHIPVNDADMTVLAESPNIARLQELHLGGTPVTDVGVAALAASPYLSSLQELNLSGTQLTDAGVEALATGLHLTSLQVLNLIFTRVADAGLKALAASPHFGNLQVLEFYSKGVTDAGLKALAASPHLSNLRELTCAGTQVTDAAFKALAASPYLSSLEVLDLIGARVTGVGLKALAASRCISSLRELRLACTRVTDAGLRALAASPNLGSLQVLELWETRITDAGVKALAASPYIGNIKTLDLHSTQITDAGVEALAAGPCLDSLQDLSLFNTAGVTDAGVKALAASSQMGRLRVLDLSDAEVTDSGAGALAASPHLANLQRLSLFGTQIADKGAKALAASPYLRNLEELFLNYTQVSDAGLMALATASDLRRLRVLGIEGASVHLPKRLQSSHNARAIFRWCHKTRKSGGPWLEVKIPVLGMGRSGKSLLCRRLTPSTTRERKKLFIVNNPSTHAFDVRETEMIVTRGASQHNVRLRFFDFGGQPEMHAAHRFFLADNRNVYLVVVSARLTREENRLDYWLGMIRALRGCAPTVVVVTHCDDEQSADDAVHGTVHTKRRLEKLDARSLQEEHGMRVEVVDGYSNHSGQRLEVVKTLLAHAVASLDAVFGDRYPEGFFQLKHWLDGDPPKHLEDMASFDRYLTVTNHFRPACKKCAQSNRADQKTWLGLLGDVGVVLWMGDQPEVARNAEDELNNLFFRPSWVKEPVYGVICDRTAQENHGRISQKRLDQVLRTHGIKSETDQRRLTALLLACEICFKVSGGERDVPEYLIVDQIPAAAPAAPLQLPGREEPRQMLEWQFDFLPDYLLPKLLGRWFAYHEPPGTYFRDQVIFHRENCRVLIRSLPSAHRLELTFQSRRADDWRRLHALIGELVKTILDPEGLEPHRDFWREIDPRTRPSSTLGWDDMRLLTTLTESLPQLAGTALGDDDRDKLRKDLETSLLVSLQIRQPGQRLAYRAFRVVFDAFAITGSSLMGEELPVRCSVNHAQTVGEWLSKNEPIKKALINSVPKAGKTLDRGRGRPFDNLRQAYRAARKTLKLSSVEVEDPAYYKRPVERQRTDGDN